MSHAHNELQVHQIPRATLMLGKSDLANGYEWPGDWVCARPRLGHSAFDLASGPAAHWVIPQAVSGPSESDVDSPRDRDWIRADRTMGRSPTQVASTPARRWVNVCRQLPPSERCVA
jgi:hypothetical protein